MNFYWEDERKEKTERRQAPRIKAALPLTIENQGKILKTKTLDISRLGSSCIIKEHIPEFTRVIARIKFPFADTSGKGILIDVPVIIVNSRRTPRAQTKYRIGFYFDDLTSQFQSKIKDLIKRLKKIVAEDRKKEIEPDLCTNQEN